ncbi:MAG: hypothetical protein ABEJ78_10970 [Haloferacaceae archaeon]
MTADEAGPGRWLYDGEALQATATLNDGWVAVTSHRVVAFDPDADGQSFTSLARPNVTDVRFDTAGDERYLRWSLRAGVYGLVALGGGVALDAANVASMLTVDADATALSGVLSLVDLFVTAIRLATAVSLAAGVALLVVAVAVGALYARSRQPSFVLDRAGDDPIRYATTRTEGRRAAAEIGAALGDGD